MTNYKENFKNVVASNNELKTFLAKISKELNLTSLLEDRLFTKLAVEYNTVKLKQLSSGQFFKTGRFNKTGILKMAKIMKRNAEIFKSSQ